MTSNLTFMLRLSIQKLLRCQNSLWLDSWRQVDWYSKGSNMRSRTERVIAKSVWNYSDDYRNIDLFFFLRCYFLTDYFKKFFFYIYIDRQCICLNVLKYILKMHCHSSLLLVLLQRMSKNILSLHVIEILDLGNRNSWPTSYIYNSMPTFLYRAF